MEIFRTKIFGSITLLLAVAFLTPAAAASSRKSDSGKKKIAGHLKAITDQFEVQLKTVRESTAKNQSALDQKYIKALERLNHSLKKGNRVEDSLAVVNEIHSVTGGTGSEPTAIPPAAQLLLQARATYDRESSKIKDAGDVGYIEAAKACIDSLKATAKRLTAANHPGAAQQAIKRIARIESNKEYRAAQARHRKYLTLSAEADGRQSTVATRK